MNIINSPIIHDRHIVKDYFESMIDLNLYKNEFKLPDDLTLITCRNFGSMEDRIIDSLKGYEHESILESNLKYLGINNLIVLKDQRLPWRNTFKIEMIYDYLHSNQCNTKYIMYCDAIDVIFIDNPRKALDMFLSFNCGMLFMSSASTDGYTCMPHIKKWADSISNRYLNSGVWIGEKSFVYEVFNEAHKYVDPHGVTMDKYTDYINSAPDNYPVGSQDQDIFRYIQPSFHPRLKVDYENKIAYRQ